VVVGYLLAVWEYPRVATWYAPLVKTAWVANVAAFVTIFVAVIVLAGIVGKIARWGAKEAGLQWFDRVLGAAFGLVRGVLLVTVLVLALASFAPASQWLARSQLAPYMLIVGRAAIWVAPSEVRMQFRDGLKQLREMRVVRPEAPPPAAGK
jgi:membrane protein required for colicin V production